jgi:transcriptional regulator with XRE-family HTH domain
MAKRSALVRWRKSAGLTQKEAGGRVGASQGSWNDWESGTRRPSLTKAVAIEVASAGAVRVESFGHDPGPALVLARAPWRATKTLAPTAAE